MNIEEELLYRALGAKMRDWRVNAGLTQDQLAGKAGLRRATVANIEVGRQRPSLHVLYALADALWIDVSDLLPSRADMEAVQPMARADLAEELAPSAITYLERVRSGEHPSGGSDVA